MNPAELDVMMQPKDAVAPASGAKGDFKNGDTEAKEKGL